VSRPLVLAALRSAGVFAASRHAARRRPIALTWHKVLPDAMRADRRRDANVVYVSEFVRQVQWLRRHYHVPDDAELRRFVTGAAGLPPYSAIVTFDDGYLNNHAHAFPVLREAGVGAVFFVSTDFLERGTRMWFDRLDAVFRQVDAERWTAWARDAGVPAEHATMSAFRRWMKTLAARDRDAWIDRAETAPASRPELDPVETAPMTWAQAREMADAGMTIGSHTAGHVILAAAAPSDVENELAESRRLIETRVQHPCWAFSYPNGQRTDFRDADRARVRDAGYDCAFTQIPGFVDPAIDPFALHRSPLPGSDNFDVFHSRVSGAHHFVSRLVPLS
jgi:peptidoglycan/xylan/chitin deacetylase (PgdA/CDA1 family)